MDAKIKPLSKEVTVMTMEDMDMDSHSTAKQVMLSSAFVVGANLIITWLIAVNAVQALIQCFRSDNVYKKYLLKIMML